MMIVSRLRLLVGVIVAVVVLAAGASGDPGGGTITTIAGTGEQGFSGDGGPATSARLQLPLGVAADGQGNVYITDLGSQRVRRVSRGGIITTFAGRTSSTIDPTLGDGGPATSAQLYYPHGMAADSQGNLYIADSGNERVRIVRASGTIATYAGSGQPSSGGFSGDGGPATSARLNYPVGVAVDGQGNVYIADRDNQRVRKVSPGGTITTIAGTGVRGFSGDGGRAISAQLHSPLGVAVDGQGNIYIADSGNNRVRKVSPGGTITTFAGTGGGGFSGDGGPATSAPVSNPQGVAVDRQGNVYISDASNNRVRKVSGGGTIMTVAGGGSSLGDGGPATSAQLSSPWGVAVDGQGNVYIADYGHSRVRKVTAGASATTPSPVTGTTSGTVLVGGKPYTGGPIPYGSKVDVTKGKVKLKADVGTLTVSGGGGITTVFILLRVKVGGRPFIELRLSGGNFGICTKRHASARLGAGATPPPKTVRRLWAKGQGSFRTRGKYASGMVQGTNWLTADRCDGTYFKTRQGVVAVLDFHLKKTVLVKAGKSYLAKKP